MMGVDEYIARRKRGIPADCSFNGEIGLKRVRVLKVFGDIKRERQDWPKTSEAGWVKALEPPQILR